MARTFYDEMYDASGAVRPHYCEFARWLAETPDDLLAQRRREADLLFHRAGITFTLYGDDQGTVGPSLAGVGLRLDEDALRALLTDARSLRPGTVMPSYGRPATGPRVPQALQGKPLLPEHVREAILAWLTTLRHG